METKLPHSANPITSQKRDQNNLARNKVSPKPTFVYFSEVQDYSLSVN